MTYKIANLFIQTGDETISKAISSLSGFKNFEFENSQVPPLILVKYSPVCTFFSSIYTTQANDTDITFGKTKDGFYVLKLLCGSDLLLMQCHPDFPDVNIHGCLSSQLLKFALWMAFGIRALKFGKVAIHASAVECEGKVYLFLGESGTGKSTHSKLWLKNIHNTSLLNDDSPIIDVSNEEIYVYGSPWSGKTHCYRNESFPLAAAIRLRQAKINSIKRLSTAFAFGALHPSMPPAFNYDWTLADKLAEIEDAIITRLPIYFLNCLPNAEAALISYHFLHDHAENT